MYGVPTFEEKELLPRDVQYITNRTQSFQAMEIFMICYLNIKLLPNKVYTPQTKYEHHYIGAHAWEL